MTKRQKGQAALWSDQKQPRIGVNLQQNMANVDGSSLSVPKVINDPIHGTIELHKFAELIMATPEFQRLRHLKQLGVTYLVYPSATHTRFEHSVGTYHLAWQLARTLKARATTPETKLTEDEVLCVALAGLCHDLGHGPFSHLWEVLVKTDTPENSDYHHEGMSVKMIDKIADSVISSGNAEEFKKFMCRPHPASRGTNLKLIKELVLGKPVDQEIPPERQFLYEIINNKRTGFDVDKWDYINRDSYFLGLNNKFDCQRQLAMLRVMPCEYKGTPRNLLVIRDKQVLEYIQLLIARRVNHYIGYQHIKVIGFEKLLGDALQAGRCFLKSADSVNLDARRYLLEDSGSEETLCWLTDARLELLLMEHCGPDAKKLMQRLVTRRMYRRVATVRLSLKSPEGRQQYEIAMKRAQKFVSDWNSGNPLSAGGTIAEFRKIDYGSGLNHPLDEVFSYAKQGKAGQLCSKEDLLFPDLLLSSLHVSIVRLYERTPTVQSEEAEQHRKEAVQEFLESMEDLSFVQTDE